MQFKYEVEVLETKDYYTSVHYYLNFPGHRLPSMAPTVPRPALDLNTFGLAPRAALEKYCEVGGEWTADLPYTQSTSLQPVPGGLDASERRPERAAASRQSAERQSADRVSAPSTSR